MFPQIPELAHLEVTSMRTFLSPLLPREGLRLALLLLSDWLVSFSCTYQESTIGF